MSTIRTRLKRGVGFGLMLAGAILALIFAGAGCPIPVFAGFGLAVIGTLLSFL
ncbi:MAG: hypothetical protein HXX08_22635 [Chloroflexi bacterium]|uniref:Uncharacterized protein n=1 Tax=Candidatus Chlorohelix allophototropha TaxID=3003348 RepID=A0A8T7M924_9CHLR|nr:hypothetical protein [Chloroflexota bacterium]WJW68597.1 hypothetical protein OZ401_004211 [Chloroflexota bacterium L227-S17]